MNAGRRVMVSVKDGKGDKNCRINPWAYRWGASREKPE